MRWAVLASYRFSAGFQNLISQKDFALLWLHLSGLRVMRPSAVCKADHRIEADFTKAISADGL